jgi:Flp pilus assembly protein TadD
MTTNAPRLFLVLALAAAGYCFSASGQSIDYARADAAAQAGDAAGMQRAYDALLATAPNDLRALVGRGTARSWQRDWKNAEDDFVAALALAPNNLDALTGLGYTYAWSGDYSRADETFAHALVVAPTHLAARKGLAFTHLWAGRATAAEAAFAALAAEQPDDIEAKRGVGQARLALGHGEPAELAFFEVLKIDPTDVGARAGIAAAQDLPAPFEASIWIGDSAANDSVRLRSAEFASWLTLKTRVSLRKDDSLSLDNVALARAGVDAEAWFVGAQHQFGDRFIGSVEHGTRDLPGGASQDVFKVEGVLPRDNRAWKLGLQVSPHSSGYDDTLVFGGLNFAATERVRVETLLFLADTGALGDDEYRAVVSAEYSAPQRWTVGGGLGVGEISSAAPGARGSVVTANMIASITLGPSFKLFVQSRWENGPLFDYSLVSTGFSFRQRRR